jgi:acetolactate synthase I/II/III large subunit
MNGAESLVRTLVAGGVEVCFANPGTSEMHFVAALDRVDGMRCVLGLFEGVVTGAADGYARMADKPAATLLHLGPGLANGLANLHNANRASTPIVNIVGDHATYHRQYDAPLTSDIESMARSTCSWVRTSPDASVVAQDGADAIAAALSPPGHVTTLILPANTAWEEAGGVASVTGVKRPAQVSKEAIANAVHILRSGDPTLLLLGGHTLRQQGLYLAGQIASKTGTQLRAQVFNARMERGAGRVAVDRLPYPIDQALAALANIKHVILVGAKTPVAFFAYPNKPSLLTPAGCQTHTLARPEEDAVHALEWLADELGARSERAQLTEYAPPPPASGAITTAAISASLGALLPEQAIVIDESITTGRGFVPPTRSSRPHDWLHNTGGSIGIAMPLATGAAVACPERKVITLEADGCGMYTLQALWTQAREGLDVTTVIFANHSYACLRHELANVGAKNAGPRARDMLDLDRPNLDWVELARGMGVSGVRVQTMEDFNDCFSASILEPGPHLIEVTL